MPKYKRGSGSVYRRGKTWWLKYYANGKPVYETAGTPDRAEARKQLQQRLGQLAEGRYTGPAADKVTFESLADGLLKDYEVNGKKSLRCVKTKVNKHLLPFFGGKTAHGIKTADVRAFVDKRQAEGASNGEINRELAALKRMFNLALEVELITRKPVIKLLAEDNVRQGFFEPWEFDAVLAKLPDYLRPPITFVYYTGWRVQSEILPLTWDRVDLEAGTVLLYRGTTKNKKGRLIKLPHVIQAILEQQWQEHLTGYPDCPFVFHKHSKQMLSFYKAWQRACQAAGLSGRLSHDFRRTAVRNLVRAGVPERVAMMVTGHATRDVFERYNIVSAGDLEEAARRIDERIASRMVTRTVTIGETPGQAESPEAPQVPILQ
jgi:integrase